ncbi:MAG: hypothetical protein JWP61_1216 [Friedmanniella sp.]|nr:hypothetical protein [Friedmanniella sp.]
MTGSTTLRRVGVLLAATALLGLGPGLAAAEPTVAFRVRDPRVTSSAGLARDTAGSVYWTANVAGTPGVVYGLSAKGAVRGTLNFRAQPVDVQALVVHRDRLYVADIGDPGANRAQVSVYYFNYPRANGLTVTYNSLDFRYPDGPHDAGALLIDDSGRIFVVTKGTPGAVYAAPTTPSRTATNRLTKVGEAPGSVTDGTFLPGGDRIALLRPGAVEILDAATYSPVTTVPVPTTAVSLTLSLDGETLLAGGSGPSAPVYAVPAAGVGTATPSASPSAATASATASDPGGGTDPGTDTGTDPPTASRRGTLGALGLAALVAVLAGVVVAVARGR